MNHSVIYKIKEIVDINVKLIWKKKIFQKIAKLLIILKNIWYIDYLKILFN